MEDHSVGDRDESNESEASEACFDNAFPGNSGTRELTLKCKLKCYFKPMNNPLGVSPSKGKQGTTRGKEKIL